MNDFASDYVNNNLIKNKMNNLKSIVLFFLLGLCQSYGDWKQTTAVVSQQKDETLVKKFTLIKYCLNTPIRNYVLSGAWQTMLIR